MHSDMHSDMHKHALRHVRWRNGKPAITTREDLSNCDEILFQEASILNAVESITDLLRR